MQPKNKNDSVQFSTRYWAYMLAKRHLRGTSGGQVFPLREGDGKNYKRYFKTLNSSDWRGTNGNQGQNLVEITNNQSQGYRVYDPDGLATTIAGEAGGMGAKTGLYAIAPTLHGFKHGTHKHFNEILPKLGLGIRRLTPTECERLQGFEDGWTEYGIDKDGNQIKISDSQRYKVLGNAVTTNVIQKIGERIIEAMS